MDMYFQAWNDNLPFIPILTLQNPSNSVIQVLYYCAHDEPLHNFFSCLLIKFTYIPYLVLSTNFNALTHLPLKTITMCSGLIQGRRESYE
jgi:hypothetical protein